MQISSKINIIIRYDHSIYVYGLFLISLILNGHVVEINIDAPTNYNSVLFSLSIMFKWISQHWASCKQLSVINAWKN